jgi:hypothetical protein
MKVLENAGYQLPLTVIPGSMRTCHRAALHTDPVASPGMTVDLWKHPIK